MNNIKKKIFLYAIAAPVLLAVFGCENKCAPSTEAPVMEQTASSKVDAIWEELTKQTPDMSKVAKLIKDGIQNPEIAAMLADKLTEKGDSFFCLFLGQKLDAETAEALGLVLDKLDRKDAEKFLDRACVEGGRPIEKVTADDRATKVTDEPAALDATVAKIIERSSKPAIRKPLSSSAPMRKLVRAAASSQDKVVLLTKLKDNVPSSMEKEFNYEVSASSPNLPISLNNVAATDVLGEAKKPTAEINTTALKNLYLQMLARDIFAVDNIVMKRDFLGLLANAPANNDTLAIWESVKENLGQLKLTNALRAGVDIENKPFGKLIRRPDAVEASDVPDDLKTITRIMIEGREGAMFGIVDTIDDALAYFGALVDDQDALTRAYERIDFRNGRLPTDNKRNLVISAFVQLGEDNPMVQYVVRQKIANVQKITYRDIDFAVMNRPGHEVAGLYKLLIARNGAGGNWAGLRRHDAQFPKKLIREQAADISYSLFEDMIAQDPINAAATIVNIGNPSVFAELIDPARNVIKETTEARSRLIVLLARNGNNTTFLKANTNEKLNLVLNAIKNFSDANTLAKAFTPDTLQVRPYKEGAFAWVAANKNAAIAGGPANGVAEAVKAASGMTAEALVEDLVQTVGNPDSVPVLPARLGRLPSLKIFYDLVVENAEDAAAISVMAPSSDIAKAGGNLFIHALARLPVNNDTHQMIQDFMTKLGQLNAGANLNQALSRVNTAGLTAFQIFISDARPVGEDPALYRATLIDLVQDAAKEIITQINNLVLKARVFNILAEDVAGIPALTHLFAQFKSVGGDQMKELKTWALATYPLGGDRAEAIKVALRESGIATIDELMRFAYVAGKDPGYYPELKLYYDVLVVDSETASNLANTVPAYAVKLGANAGDRFIHFISRLPMTADTSAILVDFLNKLGTDDLKLAQVNLPRRGGDARTSPFGLLIADGRRGDDADALNTAIAEMIQFADVPSIEQINSTDKVNRVMDAIAAKGNQNLMSSVLSSAVSNTDDYANWVFGHLSNPINGDANQTPSKAFTYSEFAVPLASVVTIANHIYQNDLWDEADASSTLRAVYTRYVVGHGEHGTKTNDEQILAVRELVNRHMNDVENFGGGLNPIKQERNEVKRPGVGFFHVVAGLRADENSQAIMTDLLNKLGTDRNADLEMMLGFGKGAELVSVLKRTLLNDNPNSTPRELLNDNNGVEGARKNGPNANDNPEALEALRNLLNP